MAHLIESDDNLVYIGQTPWHGIGIPLSDRPLDEWSKTAFPWHYAETDLFHPMAAGTMMAHVEGYKAITRSDTVEVLSIVSERFRVVQPQEVMEFFRSLLDDDLYTMETAGSLKNGRRIWALARYKGDPIVIKGQDLIRPYLLLATSVDGTIATTGKLTSIRVVCNNTLQMSINSGESNIRIPHSAVFDPTEMKQRLGLIESTTSAFNEAVNRLADTPITDAQAVKFLYEVLGDKSKPLEDQPRSFASVIAAIKSSPGADLRSAKNTLWGVVNAVTYHTDHQTNERAKGNRLDSAWFGTGASAKHKVFTEALKLAA